MGQGPGASPGYQGHFDPGLEDHADAIPVPDVKPFDFLTGIGIDNAPIGEHAINIQDEEADLFGPAIDVIHKIVEISGSIVLPTVTERVEFQEFLPQRRHRGQGQTVGAIT